MLISFVRTFFLLVCVISAVRLMGKRQIGQLQPSELVITILLSQVAATPMQDNDLPMLNTVVAILVLAGAEIILSAVGLKSSGARAVLEGSPVLLIDDGRLDLAQLRRLRYTIDDVTEALRQKDVFDISQVQYAVVETNGTVSVMLKPEFRAPTAGEAAKESPDGGMPVAVVAEGRVLSEGADRLGVSAEDVKRTAAAKGYKLEDVFYMTLDKTGGTTVIGREVTQ